MEGPTAAISERSFRSQLSDRVPKPYSVSTGMAATVRPVTASSTRIRFSSEIASH